MKIATSPQRAPGPAPKGPVLRPDSAVDTLCLSSQEKADEATSVYNKQLLYSSAQRAIFGGAAGSHILALLRGLRMPIVVTLHTVLQRPNMQQRRVIDELAQLLNVVAGQMSLVGPRPHEPGEVARYDNASRKLLAATQPDPERQQRNTPQALSAALAPFRVDGSLPDYPLGSDFNEIEQVLVKALGWLKANTQTRGDKQINFGVQWYYAFESNSPLTGNPRSF